ncbi:MAG: hypothetical protein ACRDWI_17290 [Jiangellaceae bacterium]
MATPMRSDDLEFIKAATRQFEADLTRVVAEHERAGRRARAVLGEPRTFANRAVRATAPVASPWDELVGPFTRTAGVQSRLNISRQAVAAKAARRRLLRVITVDGDHLYPVWQFDRSQLVSGFAQILSRFPERAVDGWTLAAWFRSPDPDLGEPPMDVLARGDVDRVRVVAGTAARSLAT